MARRRSLLPAILLLFGHGVPPSPRLAAAEPPARADFCVATNGRDDNPETVAKPFATIFSIGGPALRP
jgi:hypothetical protein